MKKGSNTKIRTVIDLPILGERIRLVREQFLFMSQVELAAILGSHQILISRLERGTGASFNLILDLCNFLYSKDISPKELFAEKFNLLSLSNNKPDNDNSVLNETSFIPDLQNLVSDIKKSHIADLDRLISFTSLAKYNQSKKKK